MDRGTPWLEHPYSFQTQKKTSLCPRMQQISKQIGQLWVGLCLPQQPSLTSEAGGFPLASLIHSCTLWGVWARLHNSQPPLGHGEGGGFLKDEMCWGWWMAQACDPSSSGGGGRGSRIPEQLGYRARLCLKMRLGSGFCEDELTHAHHPVLGSVIKHVTRCEGGGASSL